MEESSDEREDEEDVATNDEPPMSIEEALRDPVYLVSMKPVTVHGCLLCKGKTIKNAEMATVHRNSAVCTSFLFPSLSSKRCSQAHRRRMERFKTMALKVPRTSNAWEVAKAAQAEWGAQNTPRAPDQSSKRALKRVRRIRSLPEDADPHAFAASETSRHERKEKATSRAQGKGDTEKNRSDGRAGARSSPHARFS